MTDAPAASADTATAGSAPLNTVTWWELPVTDIERGKAFYSAVFGWTFSSFGGDDDFAGVIKDGALVGGLYRSQTPPEGDPGVRVYVNVADLEAALAAAQAAGGAVHTPRTEVGGDMGWWAELTDPDGRRLGLCTGAPGPS